MGYSGSRADTNPADTPQGALAGVIGKWTEANNERNLKRAEANATLTREERIENLKAAHAARLEGQKAKNRLSEKMALAAAKGRKPKKFKEPDLLEKYMLKKGRFPAAMKAKTTSKGTPNPFADYTPQEEQEHIAELAQMRGYEPDKVDEIPAGHEGGFMGIGGKDTPAVVFQTYKPGKDIGGSIDIAEPETETPDTTQE